MTREEFNSIKMGTRVQYTGPTLIHLPSLPNGALGTICYKDYSMIGVKFDKNINGHTCSNNCPDGHGRFFIFDCNVDESTKSIRIIRVVGKWKKI